MQLEVIIATMFSLPQTSFALILLMAMSASILVYQILDTGPYLPLLAFPVLLMASLAGHATFVVADVTFSADKASNIVIGACFGLVVCLIIALILYRLWSFYSERTSRLRSSQRS